MLPRPTAYDKHERMNSSWLPQLPRESPSPPSPSDATSDGVDRSGSGTAYGCEARPF